MAEHPIQNLMNVTMDKIRQMVDSNTIVGKPITTDDGTTILPVSKVSFGFASGGTDLRIHICKNFVAVSVYTRIFFVFEYVVDGISCKLFTAVENASFGKRFYYVFNVNALRVLVVNKPYYFGFFFVNHDFVVFYFIAVNDSSARKVAFLSCFVHSALYLLRKFGRVIFGVAFQTTKWT